MGVFTAAKDWFIAFLYEFLNCLQHFTHRRYCMMCTELTSDLLWKTTASNEGLAQSRAKAVGLESARGSSGFTASLEEYSIIFYWQPCLRQHEYAIKLEKCTKDLGKQCHFKRGSYFDILPLISSTFSMHEECKARKQFEFGDGSIVDYYERPAPEEDVNYECLSNNSYYFLHGFSWNGAKLKVKTASGPKQTRHIFKQIENQSSVLWKNIVQVVGWYKDNTICECKHYFQALFTRLHAQANEEGNPNVKHTKIQNEGFTSSIPQEDESTFNTGVPGKASYFAKQESPILKKQEALSYEFRPEIVSTDLTSTEEKVKSECRRRMASSQDGGEDPGSGNQGSQHEAKGSGGKGTREGEERRSGNSGEIGAMGVRGGCGGGAGGGREDDDEGDDDDKRRRKKANSLPGDLVDVAELVSDEEEKDGQKNVTHNLQQEVTAEEQPVKQGAEKSKKSKGARRRSSADDIHATRPLIETRAGRGHQGLNSQSWHRKTARRRSKITPPQETRVRQEGKGELKSRPKDDRAGSSRSSSHAPAGTFLASDGATTAVMPVDRPTSLELPSLAARSAKREGTGCGTQALYAAVARHPDRPGTPAPVQCLEDLLLHSPKYCCTVNRWHLGPRERGLSWSCGECNSVENRITRPYTAIKLRQSGPEKHRRQRCSQHLDTYCGWLHAWHTWPERCCTRPTRLYPSAADAAVSGSTARNNGQRAFTPPFKLRPGFSMMCMECSSDYETQPRDFQAQDIRPRVASLDLLQQENRRLRSRWLCLKCRLRPAQVSLIPCGHLMCSVCAEGRISHCFRCLSAVERMQRIYFH